jgi:hypothetical protein
MLLSVLTLSFVPLLAQQEHRIGTQGATLRTSKTWKRRILNSALGKDQFVSLPDSFVAITEILAPLDDREELSKILERYVTGIRANGSNAR